MKIQTRIIAGLIAFAVAQTASAQVTLNFFNWSNNSNINVASQLSVVASDPGTTGANGEHQVDFTFYNNVGIGSSITDVYFEDGTLLGISSVIVPGSGGVAFSQPASPSDLPGGSGFNTTDQWSADSDTPVSQNGVDSAGEWVTIRFDLILGQTYADTLAAIANEDLRFGLHVQSIDGVTQGSDSDWFISVIPVPGASLLGLVGLCLVSRMRRWIA